MCDALKLSSVEEALKAELQFLKENTDTETTLVVFPQAFKGFFAFNDFLYEANKIVFSLGFEGVFQIASFHPMYQFADTDRDDVENYTNRSPYPILHIIRENSLEIAISNYPGSELIPERNIELMNKMGSVKVKALLDTLVIE